MGAKINPVAVAAVLAALIVCGALAFALTRPSEEDQVREVVEKYYEAAGTGNGTEACNQLTSDAQILGLEGCARAVETSFEASESGISTGARMMRRVQVENVTINGNNAFVTLSPRGEVELEKVDGNWLIDYEPFG